MEPEIIVAVCSMCDTAVGSISGVMEVGKLNDCCINELEKKADTP